MRQRGSRRDRRSPGRNLSGPRRGARCGRKGVAQRSGLRQPGSLPGNLIARRVLRGVLRKVEGRRLSYRLPRGSGGLRSSLFLSLAWSRCLSFRRRHRGCGGSWEGAWRNRRRSGLGRGDRARADRTWLDRPASLTWRRAARRASRCRGSRARRRSLTPGARMAIEGGPGEENYESSNQNGKDPN